MALMVPDKFKGENDGERIFYEACQKQLSDDYYVIYDILYDDPSLTENLKQGQVDFVLGHLKNGFVAIEVKGGVCSYKDGQWISRNKDRRDNPIENPFERAARYSRCLREILKKMPENNEAKVNRESHSYAVCFPFSHFEKMDAGAASQAWRQLTDRDMRYFRDAIDNLFQKAFRRTTNDSDLGFLALKGRQLFEGLKKIKGRGIEIKGRPSAPMEIDRSYKKIEALTSDQMDLLKYMSLNKQVYVKGCAGSGKTLMAVEKAKMSAQDGRSVLLVCFNRALSHYLAQRCEPDQNICVGPYQDLLEDFLHEIGVDLKFHGERDFYRTPEFNKELQQWYNNDLPALLKRHIASIPHRFDSIIIDEAQDCADNYREILKSLLKNGDEGELYIFADDRQDVFDRGFTQPKDMFQFELKRNLRNTNPIFAEMRKVCSIKDDVKSSGVDGLPVTVLPYTDAAEEKALLGEVLRQMKDDGVDSSDVIILGGKSELAGLDIPYGEKIEGYTLVEKVTASDQIRRSSIRKFKGLEEKTVILIELDSTVKSKLEELLYIGMSRPTSRLIMLVEKMIYDELWRK